ncbi:hypothetical protein DPX16_23330 [Anabarilius grahami]|uniref:Uncharacterized protein n=1 Tax=Anabarilius grahami TaxID=495550 RepID=A0A3N0YIE9_ANAGA|nr:hypothetical protein DPX16_23330 [Anabarilius grahami]
MKPLQSSAKPEKGTGLAMGLAITDGEEAAAWNAEVLAGGASVDVLESWMVDDPWSLKTHSQKTGEHGGSSRHTGDSIDPCDIEDSPPHTQAYEELVDVVTRAVARLNISWPAEKQEAHQ